jgi:RHS repeat-associated protein
VYDAVGNVLSITQRDAEGDVFARHTYTVDAVGRRVEETETLPQGAITTAYTYDALDRLTASTASDGIVTRYAFDDAGNRTAKWGVREREGITETYRVEYAYSAANQLVQAVDSATGATSYSYDADGNRIGERSFSRQANYLYDAAGHLTEAQVQIWDGSEWTYKDGMSERYLYDGQERRVRKETLSISLGSVIQRREYRYDDLADWNVLQTYDVAATTDTSRFLYDQSLHKLAYWQGDEAGYFQNDSLGSVIGATDADGVLSTPDALMRYGDYGEEQRAESALPTDDGFTGYERDTYTGLDYARYRYYDASTGTFLTPDPYPANHTDVLGLHRYLYVQAEPINAIDPLGLFRWTTSSSGIIERGDTLWGIAADYWGVSVYQVNWGMISAIQNFNSWIKDPNLIYAGYSLKLPTPLSAYEQLKFNQQSTISNGTAGSQCGQLPSSPGGGHQQPGGNNGGGGGTSPGDSGRDPSSDDDGRSDSGKEPNIIDKLGINPRDFKVFSQYSKSVAWTRSFPWEDPHTVKIPPWIPWLGGKKFGIYAEISFYSKTYYKGEIELQPSPDVQYGKCVEIGGSGTLGAEFPVSAVINIGLWGQLGGSLQVCKKAVWHPPNTIKLILEPKGGIQGEIGASLYADVSDPAGVVDAEIGVKGSVSGDFIEREGDLTAGPYVYAAIEVGRWKKAKEWEANPIGLSFKW